MHLSFRKGGGFIEGDIFRTIVPTKTNAVNGAANNDDAANDAVEKGVIDSLSDAVKKWSY